MLAKSPDKRPSVAEIKASKWLSEINDVGPVPFPIPLDELDTASVHRLSTSLDAGKTGSIVPHRPRSSVQLPPSPTLAAEMKAGKLDETVIQIMENSGIDRGQLLESLKRCAYDHLTATYLLLGESLRKNRPSLSQTLAPRTEEIEVLCQARKRQCQQQQQVYQHHQYQQPHARSSCPSGGVAAELLFQHHLPNWHQHHQLHNQDCNEPSISLGTPGTMPFVCGSVNPNANAFICSNGGGNGLTSRDAPIYPSSHPRQGFLFGPTLPLVAEFSVSGTGGGLRRTDSLPSPPGSPINLSSRCTTEGCNVGGNCGGDCFELDWLPYQSEGLASSPAPVFSFGGELTPKQSTLSVFGGPSFPINPLATGNGPVFPFSANAQNPFGTHLTTPFAAGTNSHEIDLTFIPSHSAAMPSTSVVTHPHSDSHNQPPSTHRLTSHQRRYSATGASSRLLTLPASFIQCPCDSQHLYEKCANDEHTSGLGSSIEADSHHSSFSQPTPAPSLTSALAHTSHFTPMETSGINEDIGIDIPTTARVHCKRISAHSPLIHPASGSATSPAAALAAAAALAMGGCPRRKFGVIERPPALTEQLGRFQFQQTVAGGGAPKQSQPTQQTPSSHLAHQLQQ
nr:serine:threonine protein kinase SIK1 [Hymenolepis microstoma]